MPQLGEDDYWDQVGTDALIGAATAGIGGTALHKGGQALTNQLNRAGMGVLKEAGVQPTVGGCWWRCRRNGAEGRIDPIHWRPGQRRSTACSGEFVTRHSEGWRPTGQDDHRDRPGGY